MRCRHFAALRAFFTRVLMMPRRAYAAHTPAYGELRHARYAIAADLLLFAMLLISPLIDAAMLAASPLHAADAFARC